MSDEEKDVSWAYESSAAAVQFAKEALEVRGVRCVSVEHVVHLTAIVGEDLDEDSLYELEYDFAKKWPGVQFQFGVCNASELKGEQTGGRRTDQD